MELLVFVLFLIVVAVLSLRFGYDSRKTVQSKEAELAWFGMQWPATLPVRPLSRIRRLRRGLARALIALADWLSPGTPARVARG
jgi:hypothetical protein